jgi:integrin beta 3
MVNQSDLPELAAIFKTAIAAHLAPLQAEILVLKARLEERPVAKDGAPGRDGKDAPAVDVDALLARLKEFIPAGIPGSPGDPGKDGRDGVDGKDGRDGVDGKNGRDGVDGKDGSNGKDGAPGLNGKDGTPGADGKNGSSVDPSIIRAMVVDAVAAVVKEFPAPKDGEPGRDGRDGRDGERGFSGKDAAEIEPLHGMDESASYQAGTWIAHRNGLFRAYRATDPVKDGDYSAAGWSVILAGVADIRGELASDNRTYMQTVELSDGKAIVSKTKLPTPLHRGVFRDGTTYERGDFVQWGGNLWHANEMTTEKPIEGCKSWALAARRGRDGKDPSGGNKE